MLRRMTSQGPAARRCSILTAARLRTRHTVVTPRGHSQPRQQPEQPNQQHQTPENDFVDLAENNEEGVGGFLRADAWQPRHK
jgi:hypothetical protein